MLKMMVAILGWFSFAIILFHLACSIQVLIFLFTDSAPKEDQRVSFRTTAAKVCNLLRDEGEVWGCRLRLMSLSHVFDLFQSVYQWIVKPQTIIKSNEMFLPGRMTFVYDMVMHFTSFSGRFNSVKCSYYRLFYYPKVKICLLLN